MKLEVIDRLVLINVLPKEGDIITLKLVRKLREALSFNEKEIEDIDFKNHWNCPKCEATQLSSTQPLCICGTYMVLSGQVTWDEAKAKGMGKEIHMGRSMRETCRAALEKLSNEHKLTELHMSLFKMFVENDK